MSETVRLSPLERFNSLIEGLFDDIVAREALTESPWNDEQAALIVVIWVRLRGMRRRFVAIMARLAAGTLAAEGRVRARTAAARPARPKGPSQRMGWVIHAVSWFLWNRHHELKELLEDPEMQAQVAAAPELGRELRPLCRMLAVKAPEWLRLPRKPRPVVAKFPPAPEWLVKEPGAILKPDGTVWMRFGASVHWKAGHSSWDTLEEAQKYDLPVRIWPR